MSKLTNTVSILHDILGGAENDTTENDIVISSTSSDSDDGKTETKTEYKSDSESSDSEDFKNKRTKKITVSDSDSSNEEFDFDPDIQVKKAERPKIPSISSSDSDDDTDIKPNAREAINTDSRTDTNTDTMTDTKTDSSSSSSESSDESASESSDDELPKTFKNCRIENRDLIKDFVNEIHKKFKKLSFEDGNSHTDCYVLMRKILRDANKNLDNNIEDENQIINEGRKILDKMKEKDIDLDACKEYEKGKNKMKKLWKLMLTKIHKIDPKLSYDKHMDKNKVYDVVIVRAVAFKKAKELNPDVSKLELNQKAYDLLTSDFVKNIDIEKEKENFNNYKQEKSAGGARIIYGRKRTYKRKSKRNSKKNKK